MHEVCQFCRDERSESAARVIGASHDRALTKSRQRRAVRAFEAERRRREEQDRRRRIREEDAWVSSEGRPPPSATVPADDDEIMRSGRRVPGQSVPVVGAAS
jgi:hypothetical protein